MSMRTTKDFGLRTTGLIAALMLAGGVQAAETGDDPYAYLADDLTLVGVVRDFKEKSVQGGHVDFERKPTRGFGLYVGEAQELLDADGKPGFNSSGRKVTAPWKDAAGRHRIRNKPYLDSLPGDTDGTVEDVDGGAVTSDESMAQWFRDVPGVNVSAPASITLTRQENSNVYSFNATTDPLYSELKGFFPINGQLFGNSGGGGYSNTNYHFTFELKTEFVFRKGTGQVFTFTGDDDVFVFIDGKLVIDIGGVHGAVSQTIDLDRCNWLEDGQKYSFDFFFAERHRTESNSRIETTLQLMNVKLPSTSSLYD
jgi:fibro-slime domain-containing protein